MFLMLRSRTPLFSMFTVCKAWVERDCLENVPILNLENGCMVKNVSLGCCYDYAVDKKGNPPAIIRDEEVNPLLPLFKQMIKRTVRWHILPPTCVPDSCIVNIYDEGDCIPPHIGHHDFLLPFCTVSFLTECNIPFGSNLKVLSPGEFAGPVSIPLPVGSVLILSGNGADIAEHCVPAAPEQRQSVQNQTHPPTPPNKNTHTKKLSNIFTFVVCVLAMFLSTLIVAAGFPLLSGKWMIANYHTSFLPTLN